MRFVRDVSLISVSHVATGLCFFVYVLVAARFLGVEEYGLFQGVMGLFDGATGGAGSTADLAAGAGWPVVLIVDVGGQAASAAATVEGFARHRADVTVAAAIFNRVGGAGHTRLLREAMTGRAVPLLGCVPRDAGLALPDRHLGLVQAGEHADLDSFLDGAADIVARHVDVAALRSLARPGHLAAPGGTTTLPPLGQRIAQHIHFVFLRRLMHAIQPARFLAANKFGGAHIC